MNKIKTCLLIAIVLILQWTWGIIQNIVGMLIFIFLQKNSFKFFFGAIVINYKGSEKLKKIGCFAIGMFIFINEIKNEEKYQKILTHEYGHTIQSVIYGPLYFPLVGFFSIKWANKYWLNRTQFNKNGIYYTSKFPEKQANFFGEKILGTDAINW